ncbi:hypothetical protein VTO73DRAFT_13088 [Trametes versicolor]
MVSASSSSSRAPPLPLVLLFRDSLNWPTCPASQISFQALFNKRGQDPCTIALNLLKACDLHLEEDSTASDVMAFQNSPCACNTVLYSLFNVCGQCAGRDDFETTTWNTFRHALNCAEPVNQAYIEAIPSDTAIPEWAYLPLGADGTVDLTQAKEVASHDDSDMTSPGSYIPPLQSTGGASPMLTFSPTSASTPSRSAQASGMSALPRPVFIRASAGLSAAALITTIIAVLLFRRDRRITKAAKQARRARPNSIGEEPALSLRTFAQIGPREANLSVVQARRRLSVTTSTNHHSFSLEMASKAVAATVDFARIYSSLGLGKETIASLQAFRKRHGDAQRIHASLAAQPTTVDLAHYRAVLRNKAVVDEAEKLLSEFKPVTYDVSAHIKAIETFESKAVAKAKETTEKIDAELKDLQATLANIEEARPFEDLTSEEVGKAHPRIVEAVETMIKKGKWTVPGYKEKFGDLSLM